MPETVARPIRIMIVDDHALFRESVARLLSSEPDFEVVAHCGTMSEAADFLRQRQVDVILLDYDFGDHNCSAFVHATSQAGFQGKILMVTAGLQEKQAADLIRSGIAGILLKHNPPALLSQAIREVVNGKVWFSQESLRSALTAGANAGSAGKGGPFTRREQEVLAYVFEGLANKEIAERLGVSESSVKATLQQLFSKTGVHTRSQLVRVALEKYKDLL